MGFFDFWKRDTTPTPTPTPTYNPLNNVSDVLLTALLRNETIDREKAMTLPAVSGAVDLISSMVASMPIKLYKYKDGKVEERDKDSRVKLLNGDTGDTLNAFELKKAMVTDYLLGRGGYAYIERNRNEITGLFYVDDIYITILRNWKPIYKDFVILVEGKEYRPYDFVKLLRNTKDGAEGIGLTVEVSKALETAYNTLIYQLSMVKSGGNKKGFLKATRKLGQEEINILKAAWRNLYANNEENVVVLNNGIEFQEASNNSVEMELNESKKTLQDEINAIFHIYPNDFWRTFKEAIYPIVKAFETALNRDLLLETEKGKMFFEFDVKEIVKANITERYNAYKTAKETGFLTLNEIRRAENLNYVEGLDVVNVGLGAVLYDTNTHKYYTPNTDSLTDPSDGVQTGAESETDKSIQNLIMNKELDTAFEQSGNSAERAVQERFNPNHNPSNGQFAPSGGAGEAGVGLTAEQLAKNAEKQTWDEFKQGLLKKENAALAKEQGLKNMSAIRQYWVDKKMSSFSENDTKPLEKEEAVEIVRENIPSNVLDGWFLNADSGYKETLETIILNDPKIRNAGLNIAFHNYVDSTGDNISFNDFIKKDITLYRGEHGQQTTKKDVFKAYSSDKKIAQTFGTDISEIKVNPLDTLGSYQTTGENEFLVPVDKIKKGGSE